MNKDVTSEIDDTLRGLLKWVQDKKTQQTQQTQQTQAPASSKPSSSSWGWVTGLLVAVAVMVGLAIMAYYAWKKGKEVAKLKHQLDLEKEKKTQAEADKKISESAAKRAKIENEIKVTETKIKEIEVDIAKAENERKSAHAKIDKVTSWEDVDALLEK